MSFSNWFEKDKIFQFWDIYIFFISNWVFQSKMFDLTIIIIIIIIIIIHDHTGIYGKVLFNNISWITISLD